MSVTLYVTNHFWHHYPKRPSPLEVKVFSVVGRLELMALSCSVVWSLRLVFLLGPSLGPLLGLLACYPLAWSLACYPLAWSLAWPLYSHSIVAGGFDEIS